MKQYKSLIGLKITNIEKNSPFCWNDYEVTLSNGKHFKLDKEIVHELIKVPKVKAEQTLLDYLKSFGIKQWYCHKRKDHYRIRIDHNVTSPLINAIKSLKCTDVIIDTEVYVNKAQYPISPVPYTSLWIRTSITPSEIIIS